MKDLTVIMEDRPGKLADLGEATGRAGVNIAGLCAMTGDGKGFIHILVDDEEKARKALDDAGIGLADEGVNIEVAYTIFTGVRLVILTEDVDKARAALDLNGAAG